LVRELASQLDAWVVAGRATVGETSDVLSAYGLSAADTHTLVRWIADLGWPLSIEDAAGNAFAVENVEPDFAPYRLSITKPRAPDQVLRLVTLEGFSEWLSKPDTTPEVQVASATQAWVTRGCRFSSWEEPTAFAAEQDPIRVRRVVREIANAPVLPEDLRIWLLREPEDGVFAEGAFGVWAEFSARHLARAVSNEVETPDLLLFRGPPVLRLELNDQLLGDLKERGFRALQTAAIWIFESTRELDTRHDFFAAEVPRHAPPRAIAGKVLAAVAESALEGAKIAYQLHLSQVSRDSLKAMSDLRKAVADETGKLAESTRAVVGAVAAAALGGVGLIAARLTLKAPQWPAVLLALALSLHVAAVLWAGCRFLEVQRDLRGTWRARLYAFLPESDFRVLVSDPVRKAEGAFVRAAVLGGLAAAALRVAAITLPIDPG